MTSYFVATNGSDSADGLSQATAWRTLAKVNGFTFTAGDQVFLNRGNRWKETLNVPANLAVIGAYGAAAVSDSDGYVTNAPVIDGGEFVTAWSAYSGGAEVRSVVDPFTGTAGQAITARDPNPGDPWTKHDLFTANTPAISGVNTLRRAGTPDAGGTYVVMANPELPSPVMDDYYVQVDVPVKSTATDFAGVLARFFSYKDSGYGFTLGGASGSLTLRKYDQGALTTLGTGTALTLSAGQIWTIRIEVQGTTIRGMVKAQGAGTWAQTITATDSQHGIASHGGLRMGSATSVAPSDTVGLHYTNFEIGPLGTVGAPTNTYQATLGTSPPIVDISGVLSQQGRNPDQLSNGEYYWQSAKLYTRRDSGQPDDQTVIASARENGVTGGSRANVTIQDLAVEHAAGRSIWFNGGTSPTLQRCYAQRSSGSGASAVDHGVFAFTSTSNNWTIDSCVIRDSQTDGIYVQGPTGGTLARSLVGPCYGSFADCIQIEGSRGNTIAATLSSNHFRMNALSPKGAMILFGDGHTVTDNYIEGTGGTGRVSGNFGLSLAGNSVTVARNVFWNTSNDAVRVTDSTTPSQVVDNHLVHHNVMVDCGIGIYLVNPGTNQKYYANTIVNVNRQPQFNGAADFQLKIDQTIAGEVKDNIVWNTQATGEAYKVGSASASLTSDFNDFGPESAGFISYAGTAYATLAAYVTARSKDTHSISADPSFVNLGGHAPDGSDYLLQSASPAAGTGTLVTGVVNVANMGAMGALLPTVGSIAATSSVSGVMVAEVPRWKVTPSPRWELV